MSGSPGTIFDPFCATLSASSNIPFLARSWATTRNCAPASGVLPARTSMSAYVSRIFMLSGSISRMLANTSMAFLK